MLPEAAHMPEMDMNGIALLHTPYHAFINKVSGAGIGCIVAGSDAVFLLLMSIAR